MLCVTSGLVGIQSNQKFKINFANLMILVIDLFVEEKNNNLAKKILSCNKLTDIEAQTIRAKINLLLNDCNIDKFKNYTLKIGDIVSKQNPCLSSFSPLTSQEEINEFCASINPHQLQTIFSKIFQFDNIQLRMHEYNSNNLKIRKIETQRFNTKKNIKQDVTDSKILVISDNKFLDPKWFKIPNTKEQPYKKQYTKNIKLDSQIESDNLTYNDSVEVVTYFGSDFEPTMSGQIVKQPFS